MRTPARASPRGGAVRRSRPAAAACAWGLCQGAGALPELRAGWESGCVSPLPRCMSCGGRGCTVCKCGGACDMRAWAEAMRRVLELQVVCQRGVLGVCTQPFGANKRAVFAPCPREAAPRVSAACSRLEPCDFFAGLRFVLAAALRCRQRAAATGLYSTPCINDASGPYAVCCLNQAGKLGSVIQHVHA